MGREGIAVPAHNRVAATVALGRTSAKKISPPVRRRSVTLRSAMNTDTESMSSKELSERLAQIEVRLARLESHLELAARRGEGLNLGGNSSAPLNVEESAQVMQDRDHDELEFTVGQKWFAPVGILVLAIGAAFALSLPYPNLPSALPALSGFGIAGGLFAVAHWWRRAFDLVSAYLRAGAMVLLYFAALRLFFFTPSPVLSPASMTGQGLLVVVVGLNLMIALQRESPYLLVLGLLLGYFTALLPDSAPFLTFMISALSAVVVYSWLRHRWSLVLLLGIHAAYATHFLGIAHLPLRGHAFQLVGKPLASVFSILLYGIILALPTLLRRESEEKDPLPIVGALLNAVACYGLFLLHTAVAFNSVLMQCDLAAAAVFLGIAAALWGLNRSQLECSFHAIIGHIALSVALLKAIAAPGVFVWLSVQSVAVMATALWFRSPFIVVANFCIYLLIVVSYMAITRQENGISLGFGLVALLSARILNWQKERLQLRTEKMRNAYLFGVFIIFPYALYHLVPRPYVAVSWIGIAAIYYSLGVALRNPKYRWMAHGTLLLTVLFVLFAPLLQLPAAQRILSCFVLGTVLVVVSLVFSRQKARRQAADAAPKIGR